MSLFNLTLLSVLVLFHVTICWSSQTPATTAAPATPGQVIGNFKVVSTTKANNEIQVTKYESTKSGLTVVLADVEGPTVAGYFALATEAHDDDGLPHTLEHLIFLGSEKYPYKGVLDLLANRCLAAGTNAWTSNDHTAYTITTAGSEGFLAMLPIYCDHILYPTLTDSAFLTEVYHVTGEGQDAGVVYSEMEGRENNSSSVVNRTLMQALYPGKCGYKSETGGMLANLRKSTTNAKVKAYHKQFYRPENLTLIIAGKVTAEEVFKALQKVEETIEKKGPREPAEFPKPFKDLCPPVTKSEVLEARFPSETEDNGMVSIAWRGPPTTANYDTFLAIKVLLKYLTDTSVSPLNKHFVDIPEPLASGADYSTAENNDAYYEIDFSSVPLAKLNEIKPKFDTIIGDIAKAPEKFDLNRIKTLIRKLRAGLYSSLENSPHDTLSGILIADMLYGDSPADFEKRLNVAKIYETLATKDSAFWIDLLKKYLIEAPSITVKGIPSIQAQKKLEEEDTARVNERVKTLGKAGLAQKQKELDDAVAKNDKEPPSGMLTSVPIPNVDLIQYHQIKHYTTETAEQHAKFNAKEMPFYTIVDHVRTNFVYMYVIMDSSQLTQAERLYLPLLLDMILECPIKRNGKVIPYEEVIAELEQDTMSSGAYLGFGSSTFSCGSYCQTPMFMVMVEQEKYEKGIQWLHEGLYQTVFTEERIKTMINRFINVIPSYERHEGTILSELVNGMYFNQDSNHYAVSVLRQKKFLNNLLKRVNDKQDAPKVVSEITEVLKKISNPENIMVHFACDLDELAAKTKSISAAWNKLLPAGAKPSKKKLQPIPDQKVMKPQNSEIMSCIVGLGSATSAYYYQTTYGINDYKSTELAPLQVYENYLTQLEGPMWKNIRGKGLAYSYGLFDLPNEALIYLRFSRATNLVGTYNQAQTILKQSLTGAYDKTLFESAKSSLLYEIISSESTVGGCIVTAQMSIFRNVPYDNNRKFVQKVSDVKIEDLKVVATKYINPLVDLKKANIAIVSPPGKINEIAAAFEKYGEKLQIYKTVQESFLNK